MIRQKHCWDTRYATVDDVIRPPEAGAQVRILPGAPRLSSAYGPLSATCEYYLSVSWGLLWNELSPRHRPARILPIPWAAAGYLGRQLLCPGRGKIAVQAWHCVKGSLCPREFEVL